MPQCNLSTPKRRKPQAIFLLLVVVGCSGKSENLPLLPWPVAVTVHITAVLLLVLLCDDWAPVDTWASGCLFAVLSYELADICVFSREMND